VLADLMPLRETLYAEMLGHIREADTGTCVLHPGGYGSFDRTFSAYLRSKFALIDINTSFALNYVQNLFARS
jgi:hypothetical protein